MASVEKLQKLYHIQSLCQAEQSLESAVADERVTRAIERTEQLIRQRSFLREERRNLRIFSERAEQRAAAIRCMRRQDWVPESLQSSVLNAPHITAKESTTPSSSSSDAAALMYSVGGLPPASRGIHDQETSHLKPDAKIRNIDETVRINVGGLMFEAYESTLKRDPSSLLAQLHPVGAETAHSQLSPLILPDPEGFYYFDRDWWLFRHVLQFLRDGTLPDDRPLLAQLYREATFFHLQEMQRAIEEEKLHLRGTAGDKDKDNKGSKKWWKAAPSWTQALEEVDKAEKKKKNDWWTDSEYKGKTYLPLSSLPEKVVTTRGERDEQKVPYGTWAASASSSSSPARAIRDRLESEGPRIGYDRDSFNTNRDRDRDVGYSSSPYSHPHPYRQPSPYSDRREDGTNRGPSRSDYRLG